MPGRWFHLQPIDLPRDFQIGHKDSAIAYDYFPEAGVASMVRCPLSANERKSAFGREGVTPLATMADASRQPFEFMMQVSGGCSPALG